MIDENKLIEELQKLADEELKQLHYSAELGEECIEYSHGNDCYLKAIEKVKESVIDNLTQEIADNNFQISQGAQETALLEKLKLPKFAEGGVFNGFKLPFIP